MKRLFTLAIIVLSSLTMIKAQGLTFITGDTVNFSGSANASNIINGIGYCKNNTASDMTINWKVIDTAGPAAWEYPGFCDKNLCYVLILGSTHGFTLTANEQGIMKIEIIGHCTAGTGHATLMLWNAADSANSVLTIPYNARLTQSVTCATSGISTIEASRIAMYPNPVRDEVHLSLPSSFEGGQIDIYNLIGSKVYSQAVDKEKDLDLSSLETGLYIARISENGKVVATRKFTKAE
jgi:hypothetical protein